ncbi:MAG: metalloregulator ArsR/SmtB family transcription factor [Spirochaetota bacterium]|nr:metalloregulator ArsR/SmtB family transcription factor [Spirochaetota bacterium]
MRDIDFKKDSGILKALGHPVRLRIVTGLIVHDECDVNTIVAELKIPQSTISQHLSILKNSGIITPRKEGVRTCYSVVEKRVREIIRILGE